MKTIIASPKAPKAVGPYSQAVKCGDTLYISGQLPIDGATGAMPESIEDQTRQSHASAIRYPSCRWVRRSRSTLSPSSKTHPAESMDGRT